VEKRTKFSIGYYIMALVGLFALQSQFLMSPPPEISYSTFRSYLSEGKIQNIEIGREYLKGATLSDTGDESTASFRVRRISDDALIADLQAQSVEYRGIDDTNWLLEFVGGWLLPFMLLAAVWMFLYKRMSSSGPMTFSKSKTKVYNEQDQVNVTFKDVAGIDEAEAELSEIISFLKEPGKYQKLGGRLPKGALLLGPPGTGKTLLARAVAGEAGVPFFNISGSECVEMFVGEGAARVRDLFEQAKQKAPCVIFIDEIDAVGRGRGKGFAAGGHMEQEQTLNQLLVEMDGFTTDKGVIIMAATNRADVLDPALLRPGRFDRQIVVDRPDLDGRIEILRVHTKDLPLAADISLKAIVAQTPGMVGTDIANLCNEAALRAAREERESVTQADFQESIERVVAGLERKSRRMNPKEKRVIAFHEAGHAITGHFLEHADPVQKITIVPRGIGALGYTLQAPLEDRYLMNREELLDRIANLLGGPVAEEVEFDRISTGAQNDLERATELARRMVCQYGMSETIGPVSYADTRTGNFLDGQLLNKPFSEETARRIDLEVENIIRGERARARILLDQKRDLLDRVAEALLETETLTKQEFESIAGQPNIAAA
jgi:cell division protease FtsH